VCPHDYKDSFFIRYLAAIVIPYWTCLFWGIITTSGLWCLYDYNTSLPIVASFSSNLYQPSISSRVTSYGPSPRIGFSCSPSLVIHLPYVIQRQIPSGQIFGFEILVDVAYTWCTRASLDLVIIHPLGHSIEVHICVKVNVHIYEFNGNFQSHANLPTIPLILVHSHPITHRPFLINIFSKKHDLNLLGLYQDAPSTCIHCFHSLTISVLFESILLSQVNFSVMSKVGSLVSG